MNRILEEKENEGEWRRGGGRFVVRTHGMFLHTVRTVCTNMHT